MTLFLLIRWMNKLYLSSTTVTLTTKHCGNCWNCKLGNFQLHIINRKAKRKKKTKKSACVPRYNELNDLDTALGAAPHGTVTQRKREKVQLKLELLEPQSPCSTKTGESSVGGEGREKHLFFSQPGKNRANAKIMESIKTDNGQIVTNLSGILHAKKKLLC